MRNKRFIVLTLTAIFALILASCGAGEVTPSLSVSDQDASDGTVVVDSVTAAQAGWMVIHADGGGSPGPVIGYSPVDEGETSDVSVDIDLDAATETLYAMLHIDAGTMGTYEFPGDDGPAQADGSVVVTPFTVTLPMADEVTPSLSVSDQDASDGTVVVDSVTAVQVGWMVIHADGGGSPGPVIGYSPVDEGETSNVSVDIDLDAATETLYAMLHIDAGTMGTYEFPGDDGPAQADGSVVVTPFTVTLPMSDEVTPSLSVSDQDASDGTVVVDSVTAVQAGWMVIHADGGGSPGPVIGYSPVDEGVNSDVSVDIDLDAATETLYAMLHIDAGTMGTYEFPGDDGPAQADGSVVVTPFTVTLPEAEMSEEMEEAVVKIVDSSFQEADITVKAGTTVTWVMNANFPHTVTADDGSFDSGTLNGGQSFSYTFDQPGEYLYYCALHGGPGGAGMSGTVTVTN